MSEQEEVSRNRRRQLQGVAFKQRKPWQFGLQALLWRRVESYQFRGSGWPISSTCEAEHVQAGPVRQDLYTKTPARSPDISEEVSPSTERA